MKRFKICPYCGAKNQVTVLECIQCEGDISRQPIVSNVENMQTADADLDAEIVAAESGKLVKVCDSCGYHNSTNARKCVSCGEDISDIIPTGTVSESHEVQEVPHIALCSVDGSFAFQIPAGETVVGREAAMAEYLNGKYYVSRQHCRFILRDSNLAVENLSRTNYTYVNNQRIDGEIQLNDGDEVGLGGNQVNGKRQEQAAYFVVSVNPCI